MSSVNIALLRMVQSIASSVLPSVNIVVSHGAEGIAIVLDNSVSIRAAEITVRRVDFGRKPYHERVMGFVMEAREGVAYMVPHESMAQAVASSFEYLIHVKILEAMAVAESELEMGREYL